MVCVCVCVCVRVYVCLPLDLYARMPARYVQLCIFTCIRAHFLAQISTNAQQLYLTGACAMHRDLSVVIAEGGERSIKKYKARRPV